MRWIVADWNTSMFFGPFDTREAAVKWIGAAFDGDETETSVEELLQPGALDESES